jgi:hypothetical protein
MTHYTIKYCIKKDGKYIDVTPDKAAYFRVFQMTGNNLEWVHDFGMLSKANDFIKKVREDEESGDTPTAEKVKMLIAQGQDFEWYPSTDEILAAFSKDLYAQAKRFAVNGYRRNRNESYFTHNERCYNSETEQHEDMVSIASMLDVGAGDGRVFRAIKDPRPGYRFGIDEMFGIEKARAQSDDLIRKGIFIIGRDFFQTTLIDKEFSVIYSNPPYSLYDTWTVRLLKEASFGLMYLVLPIRWEQNKEIMREIKNYEHEIIGTFDFLQGDRSARARVNLIRITRKVEKIDGRVYMKESSDPFVRWIEEYIGTFEDLREDKLNKYREEDKWLISKKDNKIEQLVDDYNYEMRTLIEGFQAIGKLPGHVLKSIDLDKASILQIIKQNFESMKDRYWRLAFEKLDAVTTRLTSSTRNSLISRMKQFNTLDFNLDNIYSIVIWVIENFNKYTNEQIVKMFNDITEPEYIRAYKSNIHWDKDTWRNSWRNYKDNPFSGEKGKGKPEKYILDYRFVTRSRGDFHGYPGNYSIVDDFVVILRSLGADISNDIKTNPKDYGERQEVLMYYKGKTQTALECRFYQNSNVHVKVNQELMMKFNVAVAKILGWIRGPEDIQEEYEVSAAEAVKYWNTDTLLKLGQSDIQMLEYKGEIA